VEIGKSIGDTRLMN